MSVSETDKPWHVNWHLVALLLLAAWQPLTSTAGELARPRGEVLLTVQGDLAKRNSDHGAQLDFAMLSEIGFVSRTIATDWTPSAVFEGVPGRRLVEHLGIKGEYLLGLAHDDYEVSIPLSDLLNYDTLFAVAMNGERLRIKNKGPIWLLYANDDRPAIARELLNSRMIWQLHTLVSR